MVEPETPQKTKRHMRGACWISEATREHAHALTHAPTHADTWGYAVAQLVEALRYKPEGCGFDSRWGHCNFSVTQSLWPHYGPGVDSACNINEYQELFLGVKTAGACD